MFMGEIHLGRKDSFAGQLYDANDVAIVVTAGSVLQFKLHRGVGATPVLDLSDTPTSAGSVTTVAEDGSYTVTFAADDTVELTPGCYDAEILLVDAGDSDALKHAERGIMNLIGQPL